MFQPDTNWNKRWNCEVAAALDKSREKLQVELETGDLKFKQADFYLDF